MLNAAMKDVLLHFKHYNSSEGIVEPGCNPHYGKNIQLLSISQLLDDACYNIQSSLFIVFRTSMSDTIKHHSLLYIHRQYVATWCALGDIMG